MLQIILVFYLLHWLSFDSDTEEKKSDYEDGIENGEAAGESAPHAGSRYLRANASDSDDFDG